MLEGVQHALAALLANHPILAPVLFVLCRAIAIVIPPIQGFVVDLLGLATFGWFPAFLLAEIGIMVGALTAFGLARRFGKPLVHRFAALQKIERWRSALSGRQEFIAWTILRLGTNPAFDYISYAAGLTTCRLSLFVWSTLIGSAPSVFLFFYLGGIALRFGLQQFAITLACFVVVGWIVFRAARNKFVP